MKVTAKMVSRFSAEGRLKGIATVCLGDSFLITGVRVVDCQKGLAVFMPSRKNQDGYLDICFPITPQLYKQIKDTVIQAYRQEAEGRIKEPKDRRSRGQEMS